MPDFNINRWCYRVLHLGTLALILICFLSISDEGFASSCNTDNCHSGLVAEEISTHAPVMEGDCLNCHMETAKNHPDRQGDEFSLVAQGDLLCLQCHEDNNFGRRYEHGPAASGACLMCHAPHASSHESLLLASLTSLCLGCHLDFAEAMTKSSHVHTALERLDCGSCHYPHSSDIKGLLRKDTTKLCFECHPDIREKYRRSRKKHKALYTAAKCANCHTAHFSDHPGLLLFSGNDLCFYCHSKGGNKRSDLRDMRKEIEDKENIHSPVEDDGCVACHDPHGSRNDMILKGSFPGSFYAPFRSDSYDLCFQCHEKELLTAAVTDSETDFRNGSENLHHLHVAMEQKGRTCKACHNSHASDGDKLINPKGIPFGKWRIPVRFEATDTGGSCVPGCHQGMAYDRESPAENKQERKKMQEKI